MSNEIVVDSHLIEGTAFLKVSLKKQQQKIFRVDVGQVNIESIKELLIGKDIRCYREHFNLSADFEPRWFTITYVDSGRHKILHLIAPTLELFNIWVNNLKKLYLRRTDVIGGLGHLRKREFLLLEQQWKQVDNDGDSRLDENKNGSLDFTDFQRFNKLIKKRAELDELFNSLAKERGNTLTLREFKDFLVNVQKYSLKEDEYDKLYYKFCDKNLKEMSLVGFSYFLMSSDNAVFASEHTKVYQDMTQPLSDTLVTGLAFENAKELLSPTSLLYKILIKGNKLPNDSSEGYVEVAEPDAESSKEQKTTKLQMSKALSDLIAYSIVKFDGFDYGDFMNEVIDPYVEVQLHIPGADAIKKRTKTISDNGFNPTWKETLNFTFNCEELSLVFLR
ncbi:9869_t:CDS:2 [Racocetra fulgida]|uniref:phosphoinositide phospholipase C n=1 Tax=Racocetra fulgida TaxID=60492 RepID=A0A9N9F087_9GLOM|nr:9869_t:CDS:2 [Racocetra fulgida]